MIQLLLLAILLLLAFYGLNGVLKGAGRDSRRKLRLAALIAGSVVLLFLVGTGRLGWLAALVGALLALLSRLLPLLVQLAPLFLRARQSRGDTGQSDGETRRPSSARMSHDEALEILGLQTGASRQQIVEAHRRLMQKLHPDRGGSAYLAAQLNRARDILLAR